MSIGLRKKQRIRLVILAVVILSLSALAIGYGFRGSIEFFRSPSQIAENGAPQGVFRIGGLVAEGSISQAGEAIGFDVTDGANSVPVIYRGLLPDLFAEGQGAIARGQMDEAGVFQADEILAKHDENYLPREVADALKEQGVFRPE